MHLQESTFQHSAIWCWKTVSAAEKLQLQLELELPLFAIFNSIHCLCVFYIVHHGLLPSPWSPASTAVLKGSVVAADPRRDVAMLLYLTSPLPSSLCVCPAALGSSPARNRSESPSVQACLNRAGSAPHSRRRAGVNGRGSGSRPPSLSKPQGEALMNMLPLMSLLLMLEQTDCRSASLALRCWNAGECCHSVICFYFITWSSRGAPRLTQQEVI